MLNKDKYKDVLLDFAFRGRSIAIVDGEPKACMVTPCTKCALNGVAKDCKTARWNWANSEYEEQADWTKVKKDTPILVRNSTKDHWYRRYFAYFEDGVVFAYCDGATSWSSSSGGNWIHAKLAPITDEKGTN